MVSWLLFLQRHLPIRYGEIGANRLTDYLNHDKLLVDFGARYGPANYIAKFVTKTLHELTVPLPFIFDRKYCNSKNETNTFAGVLSLGQVNVAAFRLIEVHCSEARRSFIPPRTHKTENGILEDVIVLRHTINPDTTLHPCTHGKMPTHRNIKLFYRDDSSPCLFLGRDTEGHRPSSRFAFTVNQNETPVEHCLCCSGVNLADELLGPSRATRNSIPWEV